VGVEMGHAVMTLPCLTYDLKMTKVWIWLFDLLTLIEWYFCLPRAEPTGLFCVLLYFVSFVDNGGIVDHVSQFKLSFHDIIVDLEVHFLVLRSWLMESLMEWIQSMT
jgi:hypothetical protein